MTADPRPRFKLLQCPVEEILPALESAEGFGYRLIGMSQDGETYTLVFELDAARPASAPTP